jgi:hypothetical protein
LAHRDAVGGVKVIVGLQFCTNKKERRREKELISSRFIVAYMLMRMCHPLAHRSTANSVFMQARHGANLSIGTMGKNETDKLRLELTAEDENIMKENVILNRCVTVSLSSASQRKY